jgi:tetratricopeptide (TPR) repeat protein
VLRYSAAFLAFSSFLVPLRAEERGQLDASQPLFAVLTALNAAGYDAELDSPSNHPLRAKMRDYIAAKKPPVLAELKTFYQNHRRDTDAATLSSYISYALVLEGAPDFKTVKHLKELPPDALALEAMGPLLVRLWKEADLDDAWRQLQPAFEQLTARYHEPVTQAILRANAYLRNPTSGYLGRRFQIFVDFLGAPNQVHTRSFGDDYFVVLTHSTEPRIDDIRHAYLFYLLDPLSLKFSKQLSAKKGLLDFAQPAPALASFYKDDFYLLTSACLVKAVETRLSGLTPGRQQEEIDQALREGLILTPYFFEHLPVYEKQELAMRLYYPEMINAIDLKREDRRLLNVQWAERKTVKQVATPAPPQVELTGAQKTLADAEDLYNGKQYAKAKEKYTAALQETDSRPLQARAYFGLARISALNREFELSEKLFQKTLELNPENDVRAWSFIFLGRLAFSGGAAPEAVERFKAALAVPGLPPNAKQAAERGLAEASKQ